MSAKETLLRLSTRSLLAAEAVLRSDRIAPGGSVLVLEYMIPLGCCVHLTPVFEAIRRMHPSIKLTVATRSLGLAVLRNNPWIDHLIETPDPMTATLDAAKVLRAELARRQIRPSVVLTGASDRRTRTAVLALLATSAWRGGFTIHGGLYQRPLEYDPELSLIDNNLRLLSLLGDPSSHLEPAVYFTSEDVEHARSLLAEISPDGRPVAIFVTQNSGGQSTGWHSDRFASVLRHVQGRGYAIGYVGTEADRAPIELIRQQAGSIGVSVAGRTTVPQLAALLALSDLVVSLDTGTMHVGRAVDVPMVVLGPSWQRPLEWLPLARANVRILRGPDRVGVPQGYKLDEVQAEAVIEAFDDLATAFPPAPQAREERVQHRLSTTVHR